MGVGEQSSLKQERIEYLPLTDSFYLSLIEHDAISWRVDVPIWDSFNIYI